MATTSEAVVDANTCYGLKEFRQRTGLGVAALREARYKGLPVRRVGLRSFVLGRDWLEFVGRHGKVVGGK